MRMFSAAAVPAAVGFGLAGCIVPPLGGWGPEPVGVAIGWHGDQYYDGHRYWARDDWMRTHPRDRGGYGQRETRRDGDRRDDRRHDDDHLRKDDRSRND